MVKDKSLTESPLSVALNCRKIKREISSTLLVNNVKKNTRGVQLDLRILGYVGK